MHIFGSLILCVCHINNIVICLSIYERFCERVEYMHLYSLHKQLYNCIYTLQNVHISRGASAYKIYNATLFNRLRSSRLKSTPVIALVRVIVFFLLLLPVCDSVHFICHLSVTLLDSIQEYAFTYYHY